MADTQLYLQPVVAPILTTQQEQDQVVVANGIANRHPTAIMFVRQADKQGKTLTAADPVPIMVELVAHAQVAKAATLPLQVLEQITQPVLQIIKIPEAPATQVADLQATVPEVTKHGVLLVLRHQVQAAEVIAAEDHLHPVAAAVEVHHPVAAAVEVVPHPVVAVAEDKILNLVTSYPNCNS